MSEDRDSDRVLRAVRQRLESLQDAGVEQLPRGRRRAGGNSAPTPAAASPLSPPAVAAKPAARPRLLPEDPPLALAVPQDEAGREAAWSTLAAEVAACTRCTELACTRTQTVFGVGTRRARLCILGEAPGADEDRLGEPFVGRAGQLLTKILEACRLRREDVYILNILKCRPPGNRTPLPNEAANCRPYLERQLALIQPEFICCVGACAAQNLLGVTEAIGKLRGRVHAYGDVKVVCTYHPAYLLRNPAAKKPTWDDMKLLMREMGTPVD